ncbi:MAG: thioredoxin family protein [Chthonomonadales bacterium]|nr:thioredoxin family protein [Chthonomonadales bacterium]
MSAGRARRGVAWLRAGWAACGAALLVVLAWSAAIGRSSRPTLDWQPDLPAALRLAGAARLPVLVVFGADWCPGCGELERRVLPTARVRRAARGVACAKVDVDRDAEAARRHLVDRLPTVLVLDAGGEEVWRHAGVPRADDLASALERARTGHRAPPDAAAAR